jgi:hypothetical protein
MIGCKAGKWDMRQSLEEILSQETHRWPTALLQWWFSVLCPRAAHQTQCPVVRRASHTGTLCLAQTKTPQMSSKAGMEHRPWCTHSRHHVSRSGLPSPLSHPGWPHTQYTAQAAYHLRLLTLLLQAPECWDFRIPGTSHAACLHNRLSW